MSQPDDRELPGARPLPDFALVGVLTALAVVIGLSAWVCDDAFITLRTLDNLLNGYGLRYNPAERVQAFTHPLWLLWLALPYAITGEPWLTTMVVGFVTSMSAATLIAFGMSRSRLSGGLAVIALASSKAFVDYATSGLEGPLLWLLLALFGIELYRPDRPRIAVLVLLTALVSLTRLDAILFVLPGLVLVVATLLRERDEEALLVAQLAWAPLIAWHAFSLVYYGSFVPNTALAKLGAGISSGELVRQAAYYYEFTATYDPATLPLIGLGVLLGVLNRDVRGIALGLGVAAYLLYVVRIGGDFMGGRFFATPLFVAAMLLARYALPRPGAAGWTGALAVGILALSLSSVYSPLRAGPGYERASHIHGVVDERGYYWRGTGLWISRDELVPGHAFAQEGRERRQQGPGVVKKVVIGMYGYYAGPEVHIIDRMALADPVLARLPVDERKGWRIGHFERRVPEGYVDHVAGRDAAVQPASVAELVAIVDEVTRSPSLFSSERWAAIRRLHDGTVSRLVDDASIHYPKVRWVDVERGGAEVDAEGVGLRLRGFEGTVRLELSEGIRWRVVAREGRRVRLDRTLWGDTITERLPRVDKLIVFALGRGGSVRWQLEPEAPDR